MRRMMSWALSLVLIFTMIPSLSAIVWAEDSEGSPAISIGAGNIEKGNKVYMGVQGFDDSITPISWLVLGSANSTDLQKNYDEPVDSKNARLLITEKTQDDVSFNREGDNNVWQCSDIRRWCTDTFLNGSVWYDGRYQENFSWQEMETMLYTSKEDAEYEEYGASSLDNEQVFLLSAEEVSDAYGYFSGNESRVAYKYDENDPRFWWLRSPSDILPDDAGYVLPDGGMGYYLEDGVEREMGARPAFNIDRDAVLFTSAAAGGKSFDAAGDDALSAVPDVNTSEWKMTLYDYERDVFDASAATGAVLSQEEGYTSWSVPVVFSDASDKNDNDYVSVILADSNDNALYYGNIAHKTTASSDAGQEVNIPAGLTAGDYKLYVFSEQVNGDKLSDYASSFKKIDLTVTDEDAGKVTLAVGVFDKTNSKSGQGGSYTFNDEDMTHTIARHEVPVGSEVTIVAAPADGYRFEGWMPGTVTGNDDEMTIQPLGDDYYKTEPTLTFPAGPQDAANGICAVFREIGDTPPEIDISTLQVQVPDERQSDRIVTEGDKINFSVKITDAGTVKKALVWFLHDHEAVSEGDESYIAAKSVSLTRQDNDIWTGVFEVKEDTETGEWNLGYVEAEDDNNNKVAYYNSASYYEEEFSPFTDLSAFDFSVEKSYTVEFDSHGGSQIPAQRVIAGKKATRPEDPVKEDRSFDRWYSDEGLTQEYRFPAPVTADITLHAGWFLSAGIGTYNQSNPGNHRCGTIDIEAASRECSHQDVRTMNYTLKEGKVTFTAKPAEGYSFKGWYEGRYGDSGFIEEPSDTLISDQNPYTPASVDEAKAVCAVFECTGHQWKQMIQKATPDAEGRIYQGCSICGTENTEQGSTVLPRVSNIKLEGTSYPYTGKEIRPEVTVGNENETLSADNYTVTYTENVNAGTATAKVILIGDYYEGSKELTFTITKAPNPLTLKPKTGTVKYSKLKKKAQTLAVTKVISFTKDAKDKKIYALSSAMKGKKSFKKYFRISKTTGKVTVRKGLKKGTYKVKVTVQAKGNGNYIASARKTVTFKVRVR